MNEGPYSQLPPNLPVPVDDGACASLPGKSLPSIPLAATSGGRVNLANERGLIIVYVYPMTGRPGVPLPSGWDSIPGARGCTPESCGFRDHHAEIQRFGAVVFGLSIQSTDYQREVHDRLNLPFDLLSDESFALTDALSLPTFTVDSVRLLKRLTLVCRDGAIEHVFYPIFPPDKHAAEVLEYLKRRKP